jgi:Zn-dependent peptidase ImmA (M78 family)
MSDQSDFEEAATLAPLVDPDRLRLARELRGWTQTELVQAASGRFTTAALSQLERGHTRPSAPTLRALAQATACPIQFFVARPGDQRREGFFRSLQATSARERKRYLANARLLHELVTVMEEHIDLPDLNVPRFVNHARDFDDIEDVAEATRKAWRVDEGPIPNVVRTLERHGIVVVRVANFAREVDAFSVRHEGRPIVVLGMEKAVTARSRFDAAHELGHLVLHEETDAGKRETEDEAHRFAAAFLMPASEIRDELSETVDWGELMRLKVRWRVSIAALLRRAVTLKVMPQHRYVNAVKAMSARGWRTREPGDEKLGSLESPVLLRRALDRLADAGVSLKNLADEASLPFADLERLIELTRDPRPRIEI